MLILRSFLAALLSILRSRAALELENLALRHQIGVLQRSAARRPKLTPWDRPLWISLSRLWRDWYSALAIVRPETVVSWHRAGFRLFWTLTIRGITSAIGSTEFSGSTPVAMYLTTAGVDDRS